MSSSTPSSTPSAASSGPASTSRANSSRDTATGGPATPCPSRSSPPRSQMLSTAPGSPPSAPASPRTMASSNRSTVHDSPARLPAGPGSRWPAAPNLASDRSSPSPCPARTRPRAAIPDQWTAGCSMRSCRKTMAALCKSHMALQTAAPQARGPGGPSHRGQKRTSWKYSDLSLLTQPFQLTLPHGCLRGNKKRPISTYSAVAVS